MMIRTGRTHTWHLSQSIKDRKLVRMVSMVGSRRLGSLKTVLASSRNTSDRESSSRISCWAWTEVRLRPAKSKKCPKRISSSRLNTVVAVELLFEWCCCSTPLQFELLLQSWSWMKMGRPGLRSKLGFDFLYIWIDPMTRWVREQKSGPTNADSMVKLSRSRSGLSTLMIRPEVKDPVTNRFAEHRVFVSLSSPSSIR